MPSSTHSANISMTVTLALMSQGSVYLYTNGCKQVKVCICYSCMQEASPQIEESCGSGTLQLNLACSFKVGLAAFGDVAQFVPELKS